MWPSCAAARVQVPRVRRAVETTTWSGTPTCSRSHASGRLRVGDPAWARAAGRGRRRQVGMPTSRAAARRGGGLTRAPAVCRSSTWSSVPTTMSTSPTPRPCSAAGLVTNVPSRAQRQQHRAAALPRPDVGDGRPDERRARRATSMSTRRNSCVALVHDDVEEVHDVGRLGEGRDAVAADALRVHHAVGAGAARTWARRRRCATGRSRTASGLRLRAVSTHVDAARVVVERGDECRAPCGSRRARSTSSSVASPSTCG